MTSSLWNIFDQANKVIYPDYRSGYWQLPPDEALRDIQTHFAQAFNGPRLDSINDWPSDAYMAGLLVSGDALYLLRVHDGGKDGSGRPARWVLFACRVDFLPDAPPDLGAWLRDSRWPVNACVPLPPVVPAAAYTPPVFRSTSSAAADDGATADFTDATDASSGGSDFGGTAPRNLFEAQSAWNAWSASPRRKREGWIVFSDIGGQFFSRRNLPLKPPPASVPRRNAHTSADVPAFPHSDSPAHSGRRVRGETPPAPPLIFSWLPAPLSHLFRLLREPSVLLFLFVLFALLFVLLEFVLLPAGKFAWNEAWKWCEQIQIRTPPPKFTN
jgi:hypothetical protein